MEVKRWAELEMCLLISEEGMAKELLCCSSLLRVRVKASLEKVMCLIRQLWGYVWMLLVPANLEHGGLKVPQL